MPRNITKRYEDRALIFSISGLALQAMGAVTLLAQPQSPQSPMYLITGTIGLLIGLWYWTQAKGRNPAWCLAAFLSIIGFIVVMRLAPAAPGCGKGWQVTTNDQP